MSSSQDSDTKIPLPSKFYLHFFKKLFQEQPPAPRNYLGIKQWKQTPFHPNAPFFWPAPDLILNLHHTEDALNIHKGTNLSVSLQRSEEFSWW